jgi:hypothetical protein
MAHNMPAMPSDVDDTSNDACCTLIALTRCYATQPTRGEGPRRLGGHLQEL